MLERPVAGEKTNPSKARHLNGAGINLGDPIQCDSCGKHLSDCQVMTDFVEQYDAPGIQA